MAPIIPFTPEGYLELMPAAHLARLPWLELVQFAYQHARYTLVTTELVSWLRDRIAGRSVIEVGAGQGDLGYHLGIHMTDSAVAAQEPGLRAYYALGNQRPTDPPPAVERIDANTAVVKYAPQVVVASWLTQRYRDDDPVEQQEQSFSYGTDEEAILRQVDTYIHIGNRNVHRYKRILALPHAEFRFPWLWSRAQYPFMNRIWVWERRR